MPTDEEQTLGVALATSLLNFQLIRFLKAKGLLTPHETEALFEETLLALERWPVAEGAVMAARQGLEQMARLAAAGPPSQPAP